MTLDIFICLSLCNFNLNHKIDTFQMDRLACYWADLDWQAHSSCTAMYFQLRAS